jgi:hypothetical protein
VKGEVRLDVKENPTTDLRDAWITLYAINEKGQTVATKKVHVTQKGAIAGVFDGITYIGINYNGKVHYSDPTTQEDRQGYYVFQGKDNAGWTKYGFISAGGKVDVSYSGNKAFLKINFEHESIQGSINIYNLTYHVDIVIDNISDIKNAIITKLEATAIGEYSVEGTSTPYLLYKEIISASNIPLQSKGGADGKRKDGVIINKCEASYLQRGFVGISEWSSYMIDDSDNNVHVTFYY